MIGARGDGHGAGHARNPHGKKASARGPIAKCPLPFAPQQYAVPSVFAAHEWIPPASRSTAVVTPATATGTLLLEALP
jgi:hypothetical protein